VCAPSHPPGLRIEYHLGAGGVAQAEFLRHNVFQGYPGQLHRGVITSLLDGAMTNCLFAYGIEAVTGELVVRFLRPAVTDRMAGVSARITKVSHRLHILAAELTQEHMLVAKAQGKFLKRSVVFGTRALQSMQRAPNPVGLAPGVRLSADQ
jgi:acyl-coenzyme A thioesterase PaaI-like protein